jgi:transcriptional regulator with XRE-family HTH domain
MELDGDTLRAARRYLDLSQLEAAEQLHISAITYQRWEQGKAKPQPYHRRQIRTVFGKAFQALGLTMEPVVEEGEVLVSSERNNTGSHLAPALPLLSAPPPSPTDIALSDALVQSSEPEELIKGHLIPYLWHLAHLPRLTIDERRGAIRQAIEEFDTMNAANKNYRITRREALCSLATLPMITLGLTIPGSTVQPAQYGQALAQCAASLEACWQLYKSSEMSDLTLAFKSVSKYLPALEMIAHNSSQYRQEALDLATRFALMQTLLGWHCVGSTETIQYARHAVGLSKEAGDISLQLSAYSKLAWAYFHDKKYSLALAPAQKAEALLLQYQQTSNAQSLHPCIQGGIYSTLALMQARNGHSPDDAIGKATELDPGDECFAFMDFKRSNLLLEAGYTYCYYGDQAKAMEVLARRVDPETLTPRMPQSAVGLVATINTMALASVKIKDRDMEKTIHLWTAGIEGARTLQSEQRFNDAVATYELMDVVWPAEPRIKDLRDLIVHW